MNDNPQEDPGPSTPREQPASLSGTSKVLLIVSGILGLLVLACCGGVYLLVGRFERTETRRPEEVVAIQESILETEIPERFQPESAFRVNAMIAEISIAIFQASEGDESGLAVMKITSFFGGMDREEAMNELDAANSVGRNVDVSSSQVETYDVDGREMRVSTIQGTLQAGEGVAEEDVGQDWYSVQGVIPGKAEVILFNLTGPADEFDEGEVEQMLESIRLDR